MSREQSPELESLSSKIESIKISAANQETPVASPPAPVPTKPRSPSAASKVLQTGSLTPEPSSTSASVRTWRFNSQSNSLRSSPSSGLLRPLSPASLRRNSQRLEFMSKEARPMLSPVQSPKFAIAPPASPTTALSPVIAIAASTIVRPAAPKVVDSSTSLDDETPAVTESPAPAVDEAAAGIGSSAPAVDETPAVVHPPAPAVDEAPVATETPANTIANEKEIVTLIADNKLFHARRGTLMKSPILMDIIADPESIISIPDNLANTSNRHTQAHLLDMDPEIFGSILRYMQTGSHPLSLGEKTGHEYGKYAQLRAMAQALGLRELEAWVRKGGFKEKQMLKIDLETLKKGQGEGWVVYHKTNRPFAMS